MQNSKNKHILKRPKNQQEGANTNSSSRNKSKTHYGGDSSSPAPSVNSKYRAKSKGNHQQNYSQNVYQNITGQYADNGYDPGGYGHVKDAYEQAQSGGRNHVNRRNSNQRNLGDQGGNHNHEEDRNRRALHRPRKVGSFKILTILCVLIVIQLVKIFVDWQAINTRLLPSLLHDDSGQNMASQSQSQESSASSKEEPVWERVLTGASLDQSEKYYVHRFYKGEGFSLDMESRDVTLTVHTTSDHLADLVELANIWNGPISVSIFAPDTDAGFVDDAIDGMRLCWPVLRDTVNFHLIYPSEFKANMSSVGSFAYLPCKDITRRLMTFKSAMQTDYKLINAIEYPHNLMRNVARQGALTEFVLCIDLGILPSANIRRNFVKFAAKNGLFATNQTATSNILQKARKSVYVLPIYELRSDIEPFQHKSQLLQAVENKNARALMQETCWFCQKPTDYEKWQGISPPESRESDESDPVDDPMFEIDVGYSVPYAKSWEPFVIGRRDMPFYNEKFTMYGYDRMIQSCDMKAGNYRFYVLDTPFLMYMGYRTKARMTETERRLRESYQDFKEGFSRSLQEHALISDDYKEC